MSNGLRSMILVYLFRCRLCTDHSSNVLEPDVPSGVARLLESVEGTSSNVTMPLTLGGDNKPLAVREGETEAKLFAAGPAGFHLDVHDCLR